MVYVVKDSRNSEIQTGVCESDCRARATAEGAAPWREHSATAPARPLEARPLDSSASIASALSGTASVDESTGEVVPAFDPTIKWQLQAVARAALGWDHRIARCHRVLQGHRYEVEVRAPLTGGRTFLGNLQTCGSVWVCPVCAAKIQTVRAAEVRAGIDAWTDNGGTVLLMTQTFRHSRADNLGDILDAFKEGTRRFRSGRGYQRAKGVLELGGSIAGHEVTWGEVNGWHPHAHTLLFVSGSVTPSESRTVLWPLWEAAARRAGLEVSPDAFDVRDGAAVRSYVTKMGGEYQWGAAQEVVKSHTKRGRSGMTPFDFLRAHLEDSSDGRWLARFAEFGFTFHGRNQLTWSRGFKAQLLGADGQSDEAVAASIGESYDVLARITAHEWIALRRAGVHGGTVLRTFDLAGWDGLRVLIDSVREGG